CVAQIAFVQLLKGNLAESFSVYPPLIPVLLLVSLGIWKLLNKQFIQSIFLNFFCLLFLFILFFKILFVGGINPCDIKLYNKIDKITFITLVDYGRAKSKPGVPFIWS